MQSRTLYYTPLSPFCRKIRVQMKEKNLEFQLQEERPWERPMSLLTLTPAGEVPVLQEASGSVIAGHYAISEYLEEVYPEKKLLGTTPIARAETRRLLDWFDHKFYAEVTRNLLVEKYFKRLNGQGGPMSDAIRAGKTNILYHLDYIAFLTQRRAWLAGDQLTLADIAAAAQLSALDYFGDVPWEHSREAKEWYALIKSRPSFRQILADYVPGQRPVDHYQNLDF
jgi:glutathione S-transferase